MIRHPRRRAVRRAAASALLLATAMLAAACSGSSPRDTGFEVPELTRPVADGVEPTTTQGAEGLPGSGATLVDGDCFDGEVRCGVALVPQVPGSRDLAEVGYRVIRDDGAGTPVVLLEAPGGFRFDAATIPGRPVIVVGSRAEWPGGPAISCPEWNRLDPDPDPDQIAVTTGACAQRLRNSGIDLTAFSREGYAAEVVDVLTALGVPEFDVIAPGLRADVVSLIAESLTVRRIVYVQPSLSGSDPVIGQATVTLAALDAVWARCADVATCAVPGTVDDFLDAVDALDRRPVAHTTADAAPIDADRLTGAIQRELATASGASFLPALHQLVLERDATALSAYVDSSFSSASVAGFTISCGRFTSEPADYAGFPERLRLRSIDTHTYLTAACAEWGAPPEDPRPPLPGVVVATASLGGEDAALAAGPIVREPTVGPPSEECVRAVTLAWFDREEVDDRGCTTPLPMDARSTDVDFIDGRYFYGDNLTVRLPVPDSWTDWGAGTWYRDADPVDATNLDVYVWISDSAPTAHAEMVDGWGVLDPTFSARPAGGREWLLATGESDDGLFYAVAVAEVQGHNIGVVLGTAEDELDDLVERVLVPALAGVALEQ